MRLGALAFEIQHLSSGARHGHSVSRLEHVFPHGNLLDNGGAGAGSAGLAKETKNAKVYGVDWLMDLDFKGVFSYAQKNGQGHLVQEMMSEFESKMKPKLATGYLEKRSIQEILQDANAPKTDTLAQRAYLSVPRIGKEKDYPGTDLVSAGTLATSILRPISPDYLMARANVSSCSLALVTVNCYGSSLVRCPVSTWLAVRSISNEQAPAAVQKRPTLLAD
jgi:hypothetical protein